MFHSRFFAFLFFFFICAICCAAVGSVAVVIVVNFLYDAVLCNSVGIDMRRLKSDVYFLLGIAGSCPLVFVRRTSSLES